MSASPGFAVRTSAVVVGLLALVFPHSSWSMGLRWGDGSTQASFTANTRMVLALHADSAEASLPSTWRLLWTSDSKGIRFVVVDSLSACDVDTAKVSSIDPPSSPADSAANLITAHFCSAGSPLAGTAYFVLDLVGGSRGKLKVVALDPTDPDSNRVIESDEVTYNGGVNHEYAPALLRASSTHQTALLAVDVVGTGLASVNSLKVTAPDHLWSVPLTITGKSASHISASADVPALLPAAIVEAGASTTPTLAPLAADPAPDVVVASTASDTIFYSDPDPNVYCHDFAFYYNSVPNPTDPSHPWKGAFHLFYIRVNKTTFADSIIAHAWCDALGAPWTVDLNAFRPSGVGWDKMKVWAPSIQQIGDLTYMFYTGVDSLNNQSIGYATTKTLGTTNISWDRKGPVYTAFNTGWADTIGHETGSISFRDAFVMPDPDEVNYPGRYLLFNAGEDRQHFFHYTIGVARNELGNLNQWRDVGHYFATDHNHLPQVTGALESPLVVRDSLTGAWRMFVANANYDAYGFNSTYLLTQSPGDSVTNTAASAWPASGLDSLYHYTSNTEVIAWQACEHLQIGPVHFFAAYLGRAGIGITRMHWDPVAQKFFFVHPTNVSVANDPGRSAVRFYVSELRPGSGVVRLTLVTPSEMTPGLSIYDLAGRRVRALGDGRTVRGRRDFTWDCRMGDGQPVSTGIYFARLTGAKISLVTRFPVIR